MDLKRYKKGMIKLEIKAPIPEKVINMLWYKGIRIENIQRKDISTLVLEIRLSDYDSIKEVCKRTNAKYRIIGRKGFVFFILRLRRQVTLTIGTLVFLGILYFLSTYIWAIEINTNRYLTPFEIRQQLLGYGIKPGVFKSKIDVREIERKLEDDNDDIMWVRARIEGSTLKIKIEEKVNPPLIVKDENINDVIASMDGEVSKIYTTSGTAVVKPGDFVKKGQVLIKGVQGKEGSEYPVKAEGKVLCNTFYERILELQVEGKKEVRTGKKDEAIYLEIYGKKIYLKKPTKKFENYDKIENKGKMLNKIIFYEKSVKDIEDSREKIINDTVNKLYDSTMSGVDKNAKFVKKIVSTDELGNGKIRLKATFVIQQDVAVKNK